jgi:nuclear transport factor 2 (NTF2) superfamily protein
VDAFMKQLPSRNKVRLALNGWISKNELAQTSVIAYYMDRNWALRKVQLAFHELDYHFFSYYQS